MFGVAAGVFTGVTGIAAGIAVAPAIGIGIAGTIGVCKIASNYFDATADAAFDYGRAAMVAGNSSIALEAKKKFSYHITDRWVEGQVSSFFELCVDMQETEQIVNSHSIKKKYWTYVFGCFMHDRDPDDFEIFYRNYLTINGL